MLTAGFFPYAGGSEKQTLEISRFLKRKGVKTLVITRRLPGTKKSEEIQGVPVRRLFAPGSGAVNSLWFMFSSLLYLGVHRREYSVIHARMASSPAIAASIIGRLTGKRVVVTMSGGRGVDEITLSGKTFQGRIKLFLFSVLKPEIIILAQDQTAALERGGLGGLPLRYFRNGVDTDNYAPSSPSQKAAAKRQLGFNEGDILFLFVGRLVPEKRALEFLDSWNEAVKEQSGAAGAKSGFIIVGEGPQEQNIREKIKTLEKQGLAGRVKLAGKQFDLSPYYQAADVFVLPSLSEGLSNALLEAMACGLAVLASAVGGAKDLVKEGISGFCFPPDDREYLKSLVLKFLGDKGLAQKMGEESRKTAVSGYSMSEVAQELIEIYKNPQLPSY